MFFDGGLDFLVPEVHDLYGHDFGGRFVDPFEDIAPLGKVEVVVEPVGVVLYLFAQLVAVFPVHSHNIKRTIELHLKPTTGARSSPQFSSPLPHSVSFF